LIAKEYHAFPSRTLIFYYPTPIRFPTSFKPMSFTPIIFGDAVTELGRLETGSAQVIIADPPYYNVLLEQEWDTQWTAMGEYLAWTETWVAECLRVLREDGLCFIFGQLGKREHAFIHLMSALCRRHQFHDLLIWDRVVGYNERRDSFTPSYEMVLVLRKGDSPKFNKDAVREAYTPEKIQEYLRDKRYKDRDARMKHLMAGKFATNIMRVPSLKGSSKEKCGHPSQKPVELIAKLIACSTDPGDLVLDPFLGSGTTAVVAERMQRRWRGIEVNPLYVEMTQKRLAARRGDQAVAE
jgi:site-specific DNA-methyltransferase (adenine-specific)